MHSGLFTKLGRVKTMDDCIERCCRSSNADVAYMLGPFCFAVKCKTREMCKPSPAMYSDITSLNLNPAISFLNKEALVTKGILSITYSFSCNFTQIYTCVCLYFEKSVEMIYSLESIQYFLRN